MEFPLRLSRRGGSLASTIAAALLASLLIASCGTVPQTGEAYVRTTYTKKEVRIPMRDGMHLFASIYTPRGGAGPWPILMRRTPYSVAPYGEDNYPSSLGPNPLLMQEKYIFVYEDVRGTYMSEGTFVNMRPHIDNKTSPEQIDESSDTWDTVDWLVKNVADNNGKVGIYGISYPGFYSSSGMIDAHPAIAAVSPQAPIADWWFDDFHHQGAFFLPHAFGFLSGFGYPRPEPTTRRSAPRFDYGTQDGYRFYLDLGPLKNADSRYFRGNVAYWNEMMEHPNYDAYWQARNILPHLRSVAPAVMTVGGWFDAEDLYGAINTYKAIEEHNPGIFNIFVEGPWNHGGWARGDGDALGNVTFDSKTSPFYQEHIELPFFNYYLKGKGTLDLPEAYVFETGANRWRSFDEWPPAQTTRKDLYFHAGRRLSFDAPTSSEELFAQYISDPDRPVPYINEIAIGMTRTYMTDDQRFASRNPAVLFFQTEPLEENITVAGPILADLWVSTSGTDSDWIVKLIDVFPDSTSDHPGLSDGEHMGGYQMMVRSEVMRGRFRDDAAHPAPFVPNRPTEVRLPLQDVLHTFQQGHRIMVQIQSTWFPLVDRNPQKFVPNIYKASEEDFQQATQRVYFSRSHPTHLEVAVLPQPPE